MVSELMALPVELYSSPTLNIANCVTVKLTQRNYILWKSQFESFLSGQNLLGFINGAFVAPTSVLPRPNIDGQTTEIPNPDYLSWHRSDQVVKAWLLGSLSEDILTEVVGANTAQEVWLLLAKHFNRVSSSRLFELQRKLQTVEKKEKPMSDYLKEIKNVCEQLASIGSPVSEKMKIFAALHGLGREYEPIKTSIEGSMDTVPSPNFEDVIPRLTGYSDRLTSYDAATEVIPHMAFNITRSGGSSNYRGRNSYGRSGNNRGRGSFSTRGRGFYQQISSSPTSSTASTQDTRHVCQICGKLGHQALKCWHRFNNSYQYEELPSALTAMRITDISEQAGKEWYPDTGASAHVTSSPTHLQQSQPYSGSDTVMVGDGYYLPITHTGSANLQTISGNQETPHSRKPP